MAEFAILPSNLKLSHWSRSCLNEIRIKPYCSFSAIVSRNCQYVPLSLWTFRKHNGPVVAAQNIVSPSRGSSSRCSCLGTLIESEGAAISDWVPVIDQVLLMASVCLTYMAGVVPSGRSYIDPQRNILKGELLPESPTFPGSTVANDDQISFQSVWDVVREKLMDSLHAVENGDIIGNKHVEFEQRCTKRPLSLYAVTDGPRFRLLWSSLQRLEKEVNELPESSRTVERDEWLTVFSAIVKNACESACTSWMEKECCMKNLKPDLELLLSMAEKLKRDDIIEGNIRKSGKVNLYADLIRFLRYGSHRDCSHYDNKLYDIHGVLVLEDLLVTLADGIASIYLDLLSVDSDVSDKVNNLGLSLCTLSTRDLQKLRNEVAMYQWMHQNVEAVVLMYEDRFNLCTLESRIIEESTHSDGNRNWWKKLALGRSATAESSLSYVVVSHSSLTVKRTKELRALKGWRYYLSLFLELADIAMPFVRALFSRFSDAVSFFLVSLIGRSLGLIYSGIRQSLRWK